MAWMAVADAAPPCSVAMPELKKCLNSKVPRGVRRNLRVHYSDFKWYTVVKVPQMKSMYQNTFT